jgi:hypothetical protein
MSHDNKDETQEMPMIINGERVEDSVIEQEIERLRPEYERVFAETDPNEREAQLQDWSRENVIERVLVGQEASRRDFEIPAEEVESALAEVKERYGGEEQFSKEVDAQAVEGLKESIIQQKRVEKMFQEVCKDLPEPSNDAALKYYEQNKEQYRTAEQIRVGHIVKHINWQTDETAAEELIKKAQDELKSGAVFEMLAAKYSDCPDNGGDLGYITRGQMVEEFEDVVFNLDIGEESGVFRTRFGYHIAKLYDRRPSSIRSFKELKAEIVGELKEQARSSAIDAFLDELKGKAEIEEV